MTDQEISALRVECERQISNIINDFMDKTGVHIFSPEIKMCDEASNSGGLRMVTKAHFYLNPIKRF